MCHLPGSLLAPIMDFSPLQNACRPPQHAALHDMLPTWDVPFELLLLKQTSRPGRNLYYQYCGHHRINPYLKQSPQVPEALENSNNWSPECKRALSLQAKVTHTSWLSCSTSNLLEIQGRAMICSGQAVLLAWWSTEKITCTRLASVALFLKEKSSPVLHGRAESSDQMLFST